MENSQSDIHKKILSFIPNVFDKSVGSFTYDITKPVSIVYEELYKKIEEAKRNLDVDYLTGSILDSFINQRTHLTRRLATKASGFVTINGASGFVVEKGLEVAKDGAFYTVTETKKIGDNGKIVVPVTCQDFGNIGNANIGVVNKFPVTQTSLYNVYNHEEISGGYDEEDDETLRQRYYDLIRTPPISGNVNHYKMWSKEVEGVGEVRVTPCWKGKNTVLIVVVDSNGNPATEELIYDIQEKLDPNKNGDGEGVAPIGAVCTVISAHEEPINVSGTIYINKNTRLNIEDIMTQLKYNLDEYFRSIAFKEEYVSYAKIGRVILNTDGVYDYDNLTLNDGIKNIIIQDDHIGVLGEVDFIEEEYSIK